MPPVAVGLSWYLAFWERAGGRPSGVIYPFTGAEDGAHPIAGLLRMEWAVSPVAYPVDLEVRVWLGSGLSSVSQQLRIDHKTLYRFIELSVDFGRGWAYGRETDTLYGATEIGGGSTGRRAPFTV